MNECVIYLHEGEAPQQTGEQDNQDKGSVNRLVELKIGMSRNARVIFRFVTHHSCRIL